MLKYHFLYPVIFKAFASTPATRRFYRFLGNTVKDRIKRKRRLRDNYIQQGRKILSLLEQHATINNGNTLMELGTGWIHWYAIFVRLFYNVNIYAYDVWDNRQLSTLQEFYNQLSSRLSEEELETGNVRYLLQQLAKVSSFEECYDLLGIEYVIEESGELGIFPENKFDALFSCAVFEHIPKLMLPQYLANMYKILKPGGHSVQIIDIGDHYHYLDKKGTHYKQYLQYSNKLWEFYYQNRLTYINRLQASEWLELFENAGFELVHQEKFYEEIGSLKISRDYEKYSRDDLCCHQLVVVHRKPNR